MKVKPVDSKKIIKISRHRYFQMFIRLSLTAHKLNLRSTPPNKLIDLLIICQFVSQALLEKILYDLRINDRGRTIKLQDFNGQLERDQAGIPYWNVYLQTNNLITGKCIQKQIEKKLTYHQSVISHTVEIHPLSQFKECQRKDLLLPSDLPQDIFSKSHHTYTSEYTYEPYVPGYFSQTTVTFLNLLKTKEVKEVIKATPQRYHILTITNEQINKKLTHH